MQLSILNCQRINRGCPEEGARYLVRLTDASKVTRECPPIILSGSWNSFVENARLASKAPRYFSVALSGTEPFDIARVGYATEIFRAHYLAGIPVERVGHLSVAHPKTQTWDMHELLAMIPAGSAKKAAYIRPAADYLRFAFLTSLVNQFYGWSDPFDPARYRPAHIRETWRIWPDTVQALDEEIANSFRTGHVRTRAALVGLIEKMGIKPVMGIKNITFEYGDETWHLVGYGATAHADDEKKLNAHRIRTAKPYLDVRDHLLEAREMVIAQFQKRVIENARYHGIETIGVPEGLIIPDQTFFENIYEKRSHYFSQKTPAAELDRAINSGQPGRDPSSGTAGGAAERPPRGDGERVEIRLGLEPPHGQSRDPAPEPSKGESDIQGMGRKGGHEDGAIGPADSANRTSYLQDGDDGRQHRENSRIRGKRAQEAADRVQEMVRLLRLLMGVPCWLYQHTVNRKRRAARAQNRFPGLVRPRPQQIVEKVLNTPSPFVFRPFFAERDQPTNQQQQNQ